MTTADRKGSDIIQEFRLRSWARNNFVALENRSDSWHPIVLDEMQQHDRELQAEQKTEPAISLGYVPLAPSGQTIVHTAHATVKAPHMLRAAERQAKYAEEYQTE